MTDGHPEWEWSPRGLFSINSIGNEAHMSKSVSNVMVWSGPVPAARRVADYDPTERVMSVTVDDDGQPVRHGISREQLGKAAAKKLASLLGDAMGSAQVSQLVIQGLLTPDEALNTPVSRAIRLATLRRAGIFPTPAQQAAAEQAAAEQAAAEQAAAEQAAAEQAAAEVGE